MYIPGSWSAPCPFIVGPTCWRVAITPSRAISSSSSKAELLLHAWSVTSTSYLSQPSPAQPGQFFFFSPMHRQLWGPQLGLSGPDHCIGCPSHVCLQWVGLLSVKRSNGRNGWWRRTEEDESCTWIEAERRAVYSFVYVHIHGSGSQQKYTGTRGSASCTFNLFLAFLFCPLVCPLRF